MEVLDTFMPAEILKMAKGRFGNWERKLFLIDHVPVFIGQDVMFLDEVHHLFRRPSRLGLGLVVNSLVGRLNFVSLSPFVSVSFVAQQVIFFNHFTFLLVASWALPSRVQQRIRQWNILFSRQFSQKLHIAHLGQLFIDHNNFPTVLRNDKVINRVFKPHSLAIGQRHPPIFDCIVCRELGDVQGFISLHDEIVILIIERYFFNLFVIEDNGSPWLFLRVV